MLANPNMSASTAIAAMLHCALLAHKCEASRLVARTNPELRVLLQCGSLFIRYETGAWGYRCEHVLHACAYDSRHFPGGVGGSQIPSNHRQLQDLPRWFRSVLGDSPDPPPSLATTHVRLCQSNNGRSREDLKLVRFSGSHRLAAKPGKGEKL
eukprot:1346089-Amphidinium_carterae.1